MEGDVERTGKDVEETYVEGRCVVSTEGVVGNRVEEGGGSWDTSVAKGVVLIPWEIDLRRQRR